MKDGLVALLLRKTAASRFNALQEIENWRKAIDEVAQAAKQAECTINLPDEVISSLAQATEEARTASHVAALGLANWARKRHREVITFAAGQLDKVIHSREQAADKIIEEIRQSETERVWIINTAKRERDDAVAQAEKKQKKENEAIPSGTASAVLGIGFGILVITLGYVFTGIMIIAFGWIFILIAIDLFQHKITDRKRCIEIQLADDEFERVSAIADEQLRQQHFLLNEALTRANEQLLKAEKAAAAIVASSATMPKKPINMLRSDLIEVPNAEYAPLAGLAEGSRRAQAEQKKAVASLGLPLEVKSAKSGIAFRLVPAGKFMMGSPTGEIGYQDDEVLHEVTLSTPLYVGKYQVTQGEWKRLLGTNPSHFKDAGERAPVESMSWDDCQVFLKKLCELEGVPSGTYRLLTEAEWEYACRAGTITATCFGDTLSSEQANYMRVHQSTVAVGSYPANGWGLYDLHGNVSEWCIDWYNAYPVGAVADPIGSVDDSLRVYRGGSWYHSADICRSAGRYRSLPCNGDRRIGFRLCSAPQVQ